MRINYYIIALFAIVLCTLASCKEEGADLRPGIWTDTDIIDAFPGQHIRIKGQASCYTGLDALIVRCDQWQIADTTDLASQQPKVWNFEYTLSVPADAEFPATLVFTAVDRHGSEMKKSLSVRYVPSTDQPVISGLDEQIGVDFDTIAGSGVYALKATVSATGLLSKAVVKVESIGFEQSYDLSGTTAEITAQIPFSAIDVYPMSIEVTDMSQNKALGEYQLIVIPPENPDAVDDYDWLFCFKAGENPDDYVYGFYQYAKKEDYGGYTATVYAATDEDAFFFTPTAEIDGARLFGVSPYVQSRFISKQSEPGYVSGIKPGKGYWGIYVDPAKGSWSKFALDCSEAMTETLYASASWNDWSTTDAMQKGSTDYQQTIDVVIRPGDQWFCFYTAQTPVDWTRIWRVWYADAAKTTVGGWFFAEDGLGDGATLPVITDNTEATVVMDTATKWCTIKKK